MSNLHIISICFYLEVEKCEASHFFSFITFYTIFYNCYIKIHSFCTEKSTPPQYWTQNNLDNHLFYGTQTCTKYQKIFFCLISQCLFLKLNVKVRYLNLRLNLNHHFLFPLTLSLSYKMSPWLLFHSLCVSGIVWFDATFNSDSIIYNCYSIYEFICLFQTFLLGSPPSCSPLYLLLICRPKLCPGSSGPWWAASWRPTPCSLPSGRFWTPSKSEELY